MQRDLLQRCVLAFVLLLGGVAIVSSVSSCRSNDILTPVDTTGNGGRDTTHVNDTTVVRDSSNTDDTLSMVINGVFELRSADNSLIPRPWLTWSLGDPALDAQYSMGNGCGSGGGSMLFYTDQGGIYQEMAEPFLRTHVYRISFCASVMPVDSNRTSSAAIDIMTSTDNGLTFTTLETVYTNGSGWISYSNVVTSPLDSKTIYVRARVSPGTTGDSWVALDNLQVVPQ